jgi:hypothetical protein
MAKNPDDTANKSQPFDEKAGAAHVAAAMTPDALPANAAMAIGAMTQGPLVNAMAGTQEEASAGIVRAAAAVAAHVFDAGAERLVNEVVERLGPSMDQFEAEARRRLTDAIKNAGTQSADHHPVIDALIKVLVRHFPGEAATLNAARAPAARATPAP